MRYEVQTYMTPQEVIEAAIGFLGWIWTWSCKARPLVRYILWVAAGM